MATQTRLRLTKESRGYRVHAVVDGKRVTVANVREGVVVPLPGYRELLPLITRVVDEKFDRVWAREVARESATRREARLRKRATPRAPSYPKDEEGGLFDDFATD